ncbi:TIGR00296 family protein [uncultured Methanobrevibacter sp.]|uniref:TIGR00296 family protein n=1 Tax=uncultured Methanobrevibacter sp. TaxID=253161 RepID=UPI0025F3D76D|nr:TIGR00296 family protein [uncultured Methanobrevibacter sp.]
MISENGGQYLVNLAKETIMHYLETGKKLEIPENHPIELDEKLGVFVTLNKNNALRGCIGYAEPIEPAINATIEVAIAAAFNDPRFPALTKDEFENLDFEVTVLTKPEVIYVAHPKQYFNEIEIGRDGLIVQKGYSRGLLLPQVATENMFNEEEFLEHTCMKAGISADSWMDESCDVYKFQGQIFK